MEFLELKEKRNLKVCSNKRGTLEETFMYNSQHKVHIF